MKKSVLRYYVIPFVSFLILFVLRALVNNPGSLLMKNLLMALILVPVLTLVVGTIYYYYDTQWGPKKRARMMDRSPFKELKEQGFQEQEKFIWNTINGYTVVVSFTWVSGKSAIDIQALFHPKSFGHFLSPEDFKEISKRNKPGNFFTARPYTWQQNSIGYMEEYSFKPPSHEKIIAKATELTEVLVKENLKPITIAESEALIPEMDEWMKRK